MEEKETSPDDVLPKVSAIFIACKAEEFTPLHRVLGRQTFQDFEEIKLCGRIREGNGEILYAPGALVQHHVSKKRMTFQNLLRRSYWQGFSDVLVENRFDPRSRAGLMRSNAALVSHMPSDGVRVGCALVRSQ